MSQLAFWRSGSTRVHPGYGLYMCISVLLISLALLHYRPVGQLSELPGRVLCHHHRRPRRRQLYGHHRRGSQRRGECGVCPHGLVLVRYEFPGKRLLDALMDLPFALPTAVAGITLATLYAGNGWVGNIIEPMGLQVAYTWVGIALAMAFTSIPFVVRTVQPVLEDLPAEVDEAAMSLGATDGVAFRRVIMPIWRFALVTTGLASARY